MKTGDVLERAAATDADSNDARSIGDELRSRFVSKTCHDFRTPLAAIQTAEELLRHYGERLPAEERLEVLDSIAMAVERMTAMVESVYLLAPSTTRRIEPKLTPVHVRAICEAAVDEGRALDRRHRCEFVLECSESIGARRLDEKLARQLLVQLVGNAVLFSPAGGRIRLRVDIDDQQGLIFEVSDQGIGVPADDQPMIFQAFYRGTNVGALPGMGLGLAIARNAALSHGGRIDVRSSLQEGSTFTATLPHQRLLRGHE